MFTQIMHKQTKEERKYKKMKTKSNIYAVTPNT